MLPVWELARLTLALNYTQAPSRPGWFPLLISGVAGGMWTVPSVATVRAVKSSVPPPPHLPSPLPCAPHPRPVSTAAGAPSPLICRKDRWQPPVLLRGVDATGFTHPGDRGSWRPVRVRARACPAPHRASRARSPVRPRRLVRRLAFCLCTPVLTCSGLVSVFVVHLKD